jgi:TonB family protein
MPGLPADDGPNVRLLAHRRDTPQITSRVGALTVSVGSHVAGFLILALILGRSTHSPRDPEINPEIPSHVVWIVQGGAGGGGSGRALPKPSQPLQRAGHDAVAVPPATSFSNNASQDVAPPDRALEIPVIPTTAGLQEKIGIVTPLTIFTIADAQGPGQRGNAGSGNGPGNGAGLGSGLGPGRNNGGGGDRGGSGVSAPVLLHEVKPGYTASAMRARIQGTVRLRAIVQPDGSVGDTHIVRSLDSTFGLDEEAERTIKQWRFAPGMQAGRAVAVLVDVELTFTLR